MRELKKVDVMWLDARTYGGWMDKPPKNQLMRTSGLLVGVANGELVVAMTYDSMADGWGDLTTIPLGCIQRVEVDGNLTSVLDLPDVVWDVKQ